MKKLVICFQIILFSLLITGCGLGTKNWVSQPEIATTKINDLEISLAPVCTGYGCLAFILELKNNRTNDVSIDWNKSLYISNGQTSGTFMYEGIVYSQRNNPKSPDVVFSGGSISKVIYPNNLVTYTSGQYGGWSNGQMPLGQNGIYLSLSEENNVQNIKIVTDILIEPEE